MTWKYGTKCRLYLVHQRCKHIAKANKKNEWKQFFCLSISKHLVVFFYWTQCCTFFSLSNSRIYGKVTASRAIIIMPVPGAIVCIHTKLDMNQWQSIFCYVLFMFVFVRSYFCDCIYRRRRRRPTDIFYKVRPQNHLPSLLWAVARSTASINMSKLCTEYGKRKKNPFRHTNVQHLFLLCKQMHLSRVYLSRDESHLCAREKAMPD